MFSICYNVSNAQMFEVQMENVLLDKTKAAVSQQHWIEKREYT